MVSCNGSVVEGRPLRDNQGGWDRQEPNRPEEVVGDGCVGKHKDNIRIVTQNINGIGQIAGSMKERNLKEFILERDIDIMGVQELNVCWSKVQEKNRIWDRFRYWREVAQLSVAYNSQDVNKIRHQPGGTAVLSINKMANRVIATGADESKLGRWAWTRYQGSFDRTFIIFSVYRPVEGNGGFNSAYVQQLRYSMKHRNGRCPREILLQDLGDELIKRKEAGDSILVMGDWNQDIRSEDIQDWKDRIGLRDAMMEKVGDVKDLPATHQRGRVPIDSIMTTGAVVIDKAGYLPFGEGVGDHRALFVDVSLVSVLGANLPPIQSARARKLKMKDPRIVKKYNKSLKHFFKRHKLDTRSAKLQQNATFPLTPQAAHEYEKLDKIRIEGMKYAEKRCRRLKMGGIPWTPELTDIRVGIEVWMLVLRRNRGCKVSAKTIVRKKSKAHMNDVNTNVPDEYAQLQIDKLFIQYKEYITDATGLRQSFQHELASAKALAGNTKAATELATQERVESQRLTARRIRRMNGTSRTSGGLAQVVAPNTEGEWVELQERESMEKALLQAYEINLTQAKDTPCMIFPLNHILGSCGETESARVILEGEDYDRSGIDVAT